MPTGYTHKVRDGEITEFAEFAKRCARGMGALITMRDESPDAPFPAEIKPDTGYHDRAIADAEAKLTEFRKRTDEEWLQAARSDYEERLDSWRKIKQEKALYRQRYETMLAHVQAWDPPTEEHVGLKKFMIEQLTGSIDFDCSFEEKIWPRPTLLSVEQFAAQEMTRIQNDLAYHRKARREEIDRAEGRTQWIRQLLDSLPAGAEPVAVE